jgi:hypothetical protein
LLNFQCSNSPLWEKTGCARLQVAEHFGIGVPMTSDSVPTVGQLLVAAFGFSRAKNSQLNQRWIGMSWRIGSQLPQSLLSISIQRLGEVDCRALETELMTQPQQAGDLDLRPNYLAVLSEWWIGSAYAIC